jgi:hypothetical protein
MKGEPTMPPKATILLILFLTTAAFCASAPTEPNETTELSFQMSNETTPWTIEALCVRLRETVPCR